MDETEYHRRPFPDELLRPTGWLPVHLRRTMEEAFIGRKVQWSVTLQHIRPLRGASVKRARLMLLDRGHEPWIDCEVDLEQYPALEAAQQGQTLQVAGEIADVNGREITLKEAALRL